MPEFLNECRHCGDDFQLRVQATTSNPDDCDCVHLEDLCRACVLLGLARLFCYAPGAPHQLAIRYSKISSIVEYVDTEAIDASSTSAGAAGRAVPTKLHVSCFICAALAAGGDNAAPGRMDVTWIVNSTAPSPYDDSDEVGDDGGKFARVRDALMNFVSATPEGVAEASRRRLLTGGMKATPSVRVPMKRPPTAADAAKKSALAAQRLQKQPNPPTPPAADTTKPAAAAAVGVVDMDANRTADGRISGASSRRRQGGMDLGGIAVVAHTTPANHVHVNPGNGKTMRN